MRRATLALRWSLVGLLCACYNRREVPRADWGAIADRSSLTVRTLDGTTHRSRHFAFTTSGLSIWRQLDSLQRGDSVLIPLDSIAVVNVSELDLGKTALVAAAAATATFLVVAQTQSSERPAAVPRPAPSCPFLYSYDGKQYVFDSETYANAIARGLERTDVDNLDHLRPVNGKYRLLLANDRDETDYTDAVNLLVVDHAIGTRAIPDVSGAVRIVGTATEPVDIAVRTADTIPGRSGWDLTFRRPEAAPDTLALVLTLKNSYVAPFVLQHTVGLLGSDVYAWYASMRSLMPRALVQSWIQREGFLEVRLPGSGADWRTVARIPDVGPAIAKTVVVLLNARHWTGDTIRVRLESSPGLWLMDRAELAADMGRAETIRLRPTRAVNQLGRDVASLLSAADGKYHVALRGERVELEFDAGSQVPGLTRTVLASTTGHYYMKVDDTAAPRRDIVERLMRDRAFMQQYFADAWVKAGGSPIVNTR